MKIYSIAVGVFCLVSCFSGSARAGVLALHTGSANPTTQGWTEHPPTTAGDVLVGPIIDGGVQSWIVNDISTNAGSTYTYDQAISDADIAQGNSDGWELHFNFRVLWSEETEDGTLFAGYRDGVTAWQMNFGFDASANTVVKLFTDVSGPILGPTFVVPGNAYHTYSLIYDPLSMTADFFVDGIERISNYGGYASSDKIAVFGAGLDPGVGIGKFHTVLLNTLDRPVPEPSTFVLAGLACAGLLLVRRRKM